MTIMGIVTSLGVLVGSYLIVSVKQIAFLTSEYCRH